MINKSKLALIAALAAVSIASPAYAQALSHDGSLLPHYFGTAGEIVWGSWGPLQASPIVNHTIAHSARQLYLYAPGGAGSFASVRPASRPDLNPNSPSLTGGGSLGYNKNLYNY